MRDTDLNFLIMSFSGFDIRIMLTLLNNLGNPVAPLFSEKVYIGS